ncbi:MAG: DMT family transporter [Propionibacteriaceae bacterium]|nr:DMT family transporter [Propionibacteriaceae bacterium]
MRHVLLVLSASVLFGTTGTTQTFAPDAATSLSVGSVRMVAGGALMALLGYVNHRRAGSRSPRPAPGRGGRLPTWLALGGAGLGMALYQVTFFAGTRANGVAVGTIITLGSAPLAAGLGDWLIRRQRPGRPWLVATGLAVVGVVLLSGAAGDVHVVGVALSAGAGLAYAVELVLLKIVLDRGWRSSDAVSWVMGVGAVLTLPVLVAGDASWVATPRGAAVATWLAVATIVAAYQFLALGLTGLPAATVTTLTLAEPATATILGLVVLHEHLTMTGLAGVLAIAGGLVILARSTGR